MRDKKKHVYYIIVEMTDGEIVRFLPNTLRKTLNEAWDAVPAEDVYYKRHRVVYIATYIEELQKYCNMKAIKIDIRKAVL
jgi:hypothetical protein